MEHALAVTAKIKASSGSFAILEATTCGCCVWSNSHCTPRSFRGTRVWLELKMQKCNRCL